MPAAYDVVVAGGGPAGAATALLLAAAGRSVALLERSRFDRPRLGETLAPTVQPLLRRLGVWDRFGALDPLPSWGTRSAWSRPDPADHSHLVSGYHSGWHVDRTAFDRMLAAAAADAGAHVVPGASVTGCRYDGTVWEVACAGGHRVGGRVLVDATGRQGGPGRGLGAHRARFDHLVAVAVVLAGIDVSAERYLLVEAVGDGWWYTAPLPGDRLVSVLMTDVDTCRRAGLGRSGPWHRTLGAAPLTAGRVGPVPAGAAPRVHPAGSHRLRRGADVRPWLAVGDAALAVDPVSGTGVSRALRTAEAAAETAGRLLDRPAAAAETIGRYESARDGECTAYLVERAEHYGRVRRFQTAFWSRRRVLAEGVHREA